MVGTWTGDVPRRTSLLYLVVPFVPLAGALVTLGLWAGGGPSDPYRRVWALLAISLGCSTVVLAGLFWWLRSRIRPLVLTIDEAGLRLTQDDSVVCLDFANVASADYLPQLQAVTVRLRSQPPGWAPSPTTAHSQPWARPLGLGSFTDAQRAEILAALRTGVIGAGGIVGGPDAGWPGVVPCG